MADAVVIDDGGSTRIKQLKRTTADGKMDDLLSPGNSDNAKGTFSKMEINYFDQNGKAGTPIPINLGAGDMVTIHSANQQKVLAALNTAKQLTITLLSGVAGVEPLVHGKQNGDQRRYVVSNAGSIEKIEVTPAGSPNPNPSVYNTALPNRPETAAIYSMVILT